MTFKINQQLFINRILLRKIRAKMIARLNSRLKQSTLEKKSHSKFLSQIYLTDTKLRYYQIVLKSDLK